MDTDWGRTRAEASIEAFRAAIIGADVGIVDTPTGRKNVSISWNDEDGFHSKDDVAIGVYRTSDEDNLDRNRVVIDWTDGTRTSVERDDIITFDEGEYY